MAQNDKTTATPKTLPFHETSNAGGVDYDSPWKQGSIAPDPFAANVTQAGKGPRGYVRRDERIYEDVCEALKANDDLDCCGVEVAVKAGKGMLKGIVPSAWAAHESEKVARGCPGVKEVDNQLQASKKD